ncbi:Crp/Fnr family transcriptional regulator [Myroides fluvii]|uniref:Crp/Fnr family transcriptional regulator n=1 Tax=Myroides fluvii TaxID=2572594 RepID=UPI00131D80B7|nr:Crp/Fnr family transcriptional regulator [Myroides fluvii]
MDLITALYSNLEQVNCWDKTITLNRNEYLTLAGTMDTNVYYIETGSLKISIILDDCEHIVRFGYRHNFIAALDSFITHTPTDFYIQALKKTTIKVIHKERYLEFIRSNSNHQSLWDSLLQNLILQQLEREKDLLIKSPKERYIRVLQRSPHLFQEIPNKYIATYLGMSPETLSRLKKS